MKNLPIVFILLFLPFVCFAGIISNDEIQIKGAKPSDNYTILEFNPGQDIIDDTKGISSTFLTTKFYYGFNDKKNDIGIEIPMLRNEGNNDGLNGLGDILLATNYTGTILKQLLYGLQLELNLPTATESELGLGRFQISPAAFLEYSFSNGFFIAGGVKYYHTFWGDSDRVIINKLRLRSNFGYISPTDWWIIVDPKYYFDLENGKKEIYLEFEGGFMFRGNVAFYLKPGFHVAGALRSKDWNMQIGVKFFNLI
ncbi:MAG: hypothetical protein J5594_05015 [Elusimicrobiaceae bacterium]|nr:hypothetical protein [Elusimicrobiaceae bacterium]